MTECEFITLQSPTHYHGFHLLTSELQNPVNECHFDNTLHLLLKPYT